MKGIVSRNLSVHQEHELLLRLESAGLASDLAQKVIESTDNRLAAAVVKSIKHGGFQGNSRYLLARETMGQNFLGIEETSEHYGVVFTREDLTTLANIPFSQALLEQCQKTHLLVAGFPLSLWDMNSITKKKGVGILSQTSCWWRGQKFVSQERVTARWYLIRKALVRGSISKSFKEQEVLVPQEKVPGACDLVYAIALYFMATGERLFQDRHCFARSSSVDNQDTPVFVGEFVDYPEPRLSVTSFLTTSLKWHGYSRCDDTGIASARYTE